LWALELQSRRVRRALQSRIQYSLHKAGIYHSPPSNAHPLTYAHSHRTHNHYLPLRDHAHDCATFVYTYVSREGGSAPLGAAATYPSTNTSLKILVTCTPPTHTISRAELQAIDLGLKLRHHALLSDSACSLRLIHKYIRSPPPCINTLIYPIYTPNPHHGRSDDTSR
jgi:hypothetical protein